MISPVMPLAPFCLLSILLAVMLKPYLGMFSALDERIRASVVPASGEQESGAGHDESGADEVRFGGHG